MSDESLRERFQALRRREAQQAPSFERTLARARADRAAPRQPRRSVLAPRRWVWAPAAAAAAVLIWLLRVPGVPAPVPFDPGTWAMPTDVLLELPGSDLLHGVPAIGTGLERRPEPIETGWHRRILG